MGKQNCRIHWCWHDWSVACSFRIHIQKLLLWLILHFSNFCFFLCSHKLCRSLMVHSLQLSLPPPSFFPPVFSFRIPSDGPGGPLGPSSSPGSCCLTYWRIWIVTPWAPLDHCSPYICISVKFYASSLWSLCFTANYLVWPALFQVTTVERRSCGSGSTWRCLSLLSRPPGSTHFTYIMICSFFFFSSAWQIFLTQINGLRKEDVVHCTDCAAYWGNVIMSLGYIN